MARARVEALAIQAADPPHLRVHWSDYIRVVPAATAGVLPFRPRDAAPAGEDAA